MWLNLVHTPIRDLQVAYHHPRLRGIICIALFLKTAGTGSKSAVWNDVLTSHGSSCVVFAVAVVMAVVVVQVW